MTVVVENLEKLERKMTLTLPVNAIQSEVTARLKRLARQVKIDGFRPGKVPMNIVAQRYGYSVQYEVMNDKVGEAFRSPPTKPSCVWPVNRASAKKRAPPKASCLLTRSLRFTPKSRCLNWPRWRCLATPRM